MTLDAPKISYKLSNLFLLLTHSDSHGGEPLFGKFSPQSKRHLQLVMLCWVYNFPDIMSTPLCPPHNTTLPGGDVKGANCLAKQRRIVPPPWRQRRRKTNKKKSEKIVSHLPLMATMENGGKTTKTPFKSSMTFKMQLHNWNEIQCGSIVRSNV